jgi:steroid delta-isomerase-like uncharacterized protein
MPTDAIQSDPFLRKMLDVYNSHRAEAFDELLTEDCVLVRNGEEARGREAFERVIGKMYRAFPDIEYQIDDAVTSGDKTAIRWQGRGTHRGEYLGVAPTGKAINYAGITILERSGDRIARVWVSADQLALLRSLREAAPAQAQPAAH